MKKLMNMCLILICFLPLGIAQGQNGGVSIGKSGEEAHPNAILEVYSESKGLLIPRVTTETMEQMFPVADPTAEGLMLYDIEQSMFYYYDGEVWLPLAISMQSDTIIGIQGGFNEVITIYNQSENFYSQKGTVDTLVVSELLDALKASIDTLISEHATIKELHTISASIDTLYSKIAEFDNLVVNFNLTAESVTTENITSVMAQLDSLFADYAKITELMATEAYITYLEGQKGVFDTLVVNSGIDVEDINVDSIYAQYFNAENFTSNQANVVNIYGQGAEFDTLTVKEIAEIQKVISETIIAEVANFDSLFSEYIEVIKLKAEEADITNLNSDNGVFNTITVNEIANIQKVMSDSISAMVADFDSIFGMYMSVNELIANNAEITSLVSQYGEIDSLTVNDIAHIKSVYSDSITAMMAQFDSIFASYIEAKEIVSEEATIGNINSDTIVVESLIGTEVTFDKVTADSSFMGYLVADSAMVDYAKMIYIAAQEIEADTAVINNLQASEADIDTLVLGGDTATHIAVAGDVVENSQQTLASVDYVESTVESNMAYNYNREVSRNDWDFGGMNLSGGVDEGNVVEFLNRVFFPVPPPEIDEFTVTNPGYTIPFSVWRSFGTDMEFDFHYKVINTSKVNANTGDETDLTRLEVVFEDAAVASADLSSQGAIVEGDFMNVTAPKPDAHLGDSLEFKLEVDDAYDNKVDQILTVVLADAIALTQASPTLDGSTSMKVFERDNIDKDVTIGWTVTENDEQVVDILIDGAAIGNNNASGSVTQTFPGSEPTRKRWSVNVEGDLYGVVGSNMKYTPYAYWGDARYYGLVNKTSGFDLSDIMAIPSSPGGVKEVKVAPDHLFAQTPNAGKTTGDADYFTTVYEFYPDGADKYYVCFASLDDGDHAIWLLNLGTWAQQSTEKYPVTYVNGNYTATYYVYVLTQQGYNAAGSVKAALGPKF